MNKHLSTPDIRRNYRFLGCMLLCIAAGCLTGFLWPGAAALEPLGTVFINLMFCLVVPLVFSSIAGAIANMRSSRRAGRIMGVTVAVFVITGVIASVIMIVLMHLFPPVTAPWNDLAAGTVDEPASVATLLVNFFTVSDFNALLSRRAMLPLIVFSVLFGFGVQLAGGPDTLAAHILQDLSACMLKVVRIVTYYAPIAFFGFFAAMTAHYGAEITAAYGKALSVYYFLCFAYLLTAFPLFARFGGGKGAVRVMARHIMRPALTSLGTCSSVATIPTNLEQAEQTGISRDVAEMVIPLGATMHMDGSCFSCVLKVAFLFGVFGIPFSSPGTLLLVILVSVFSAVGMSGIPGGGYIGEYILCCIFFPDQLAVAYPIAITIGNLIDPPATMINSAGDYVAAFIVSRFIDGKDWLQKQLSRTV